MRATLFSLAAVSLLQLTTAQPHRRHQAHKAAHVKKDVVTVVSTAYGEATEVAEVVVYVNPAGAPVSTATEYAPNVPVPTTVSIPTTSVLAPVVSTASPTPHPSSSSTFAVSSSSSSTAAAPSGGFSGGSGSGITYGPYNTDGTCRSAEQVMNDIAALPAGKYKRIRTYGSDCSTITSVLAACKAHGYQLWAGLFSLSTLTSDLESLIAAVAGDWSSIYIVTIGNELVNSGAADAGTVVAAVSQARGILRGAGYQGPVGTVDTCVAVLSNPVLCNDSDMCTCNCHPFFDPNTPASGAGAFLTNMISELKGVISNSAKPIIIAETGYPTAGFPNGLAVPSPANQAAALESIAEAFSANPGAVNYFSSYSTAWKEDNPSTFGAEKFWGIYSYPG